MTPRHKPLLVVVSLLASLLMSSVARAEAPATVSPAGAATLRTLAVLPSTDTSGLNLAVPLQNALAQLYQSLNYFNISLSSAALSGFAPGDVRKLHEALGVELVTFAYLEKERVALFLFDVTRPGEFIVASQPLTDSTGTPVLTSEFIEAQFRAAFNQLVTQYSQGQFQGLPGSRVDSQGLAQEEQEDVKRRAAESRRLFRELAALEEKPLYLGANIGMARFSGGGSSASTVNIGAMVGYRLNDRFRLELGADVFSYSMLHVGTRYHLPLAEKYLSLDVSLEVGRIQGALTRNLGYESVYIPNGQMMFGPGLSFQIPLLGTSVRGDLRFYVGGGSVLFGTYGLSYSI